MNIKYISIKVEMNNDVINIIYVLLNSFTLLIILALKCLIYISSSFTIKIKLSFVFLENPLIKEIVIVIKPKSISIK